MALVHARAENLIAGAYYGDLDRVKEALEDGADIRFTLYFSDDEREYSHVEFNALHAAASGGNEDVINYLLEQHLDINTQTPDGWTPLFIAARDGHAEAAKLLVFRGADINLPTNLGASALLMAVTQPYPTEKERLDLITYLLENEADPNLNANNLWPPLYYAAVTQRLPVVQLLIEHNAHVTPTLYQAVATYLQKHPAQTNHKMIDLLKKAMINK